MPRKHPQVLGVDLNRSEASHLLISHDFFPESDTKRRSRRTLRNKRFSRASDTTATKDERALAPGRRRDWQRAYRLSKRLWSYQMVRLDHDDARATMTAARSSFDAEARARQKICRQAILDAAEAFDVDDPLLVVLGMQLRRTGRKDLCDAVFHGRLDLRQALKIARTPPGPQGDLFGFYHARSSLPPRDEAER